jgi:hypothetical protein
MSGFRRIIISFFSLSIFASPETGELSATEIPFSRDGALPVIRKIIEKKALPFTIRKKDLEISITGIDDISVDWNTSRVRVSCSFTVTTTGLIRISKKGNISLSGEALLSKKENGIGVRIQGIDSLSVDGLPDMVNAYARSLTDKSMKGKEYWTGDAPAASEALTGENFSDMLKILLSKKMPCSFSTKTSSVLLLRLYSFETPRPGNIVATFRMRGTRKGFFDVDFAGVATVVCTLTIDPETLVAKLTIRDITGLRFDDRNFIMQGILGSVTRSSLEGKTMSFNLGKTK